MKRALCILLFCAVLAGCGAESAQVVNDLNKDEPLRIVAVIQSSVPATATPAVSRPPEGSADEPSQGLGLWPGLWPASSSDAPGTVDTPAPTDASTASPVPEDTAEPTDTPVPTALPTATPDLPWGMQLVMVAQQYLNYPFCRGGDSPKKGFDPSGLVYWCLKEMGVDVKRRTSVGYAEEERWTKITRLSDLEPGDLLFFRTGDNENINCVCIYLGNNMMIYPSTSKQMVITAEINGYWTNAFQWARRVF